MMRSMFSGVSGLRNHQTRMDVIGNNIANVNTIGFKGGRVNFQDILSQTTQGASSPQGNRGGTNPMQVGLGMSVATIDTLFTDGSTQSTGKQTDLAMQGQGFFIVNDGAKSYYTRAGNFDFDTLGNFLVPGTGLRVQGWMANAAGAITTTGVPGNIQIPVGTTMAPAASTQVELTKNLNATTVAGAGGAIQKSVLVYDTLGQAHTVDLTFTKANPPTIAANITGAQFDNVTVGSSNIDAITVYDNLGVARNLTVTTTRTALGWDYTVQEGATTLASGLNAPLGTFTGGIAVTDGGPLNFTLRYPGAVAGAGFVPGVPGYTSGPATNAWTWTCSTAEAGVTVTPAGNNITFNPATGVIATGGTGGTITVAGIATGATVPVLTVDLTRLTQYASETTITASEPDGYAAGSLLTVTIDTSGILTGRFSNGRSQALAQVALATFNNPGGLFKASENTYEQSNNSGMAQVGTANSGGRGRVSPGSLEMSNVDLSQQFTDMIVTQRGFQANSKIITTSDEMLQDLVNLKR